MTTHSLFDPSTNTFTYVVYDEASKDAIVIDPVLNYDPLTSEVSTRSLDQLERFILTHRLNVHMVLETHVHADHLTASDLLRKKWRCPIGISSRIGETQKTFADLFNLDISLDGSQFDHLLKHGDKLKIGTLGLEVRHIPGHTPTCAAYIIDGACFVGDALFLPHRGCGRCDFSGGSAENLYDSIMQQIYTLPDEMPLYVGHDYPKENESPRCQTTVAESKAHNCMIPGHASREEFIHKRCTRDSALALPKLIYQSLQVNISGGKLPPTQGNHKRYLQIPIFLQGEL